MNRCSPLHIQRRLHRNMAAEHARGRFRRTKSEQAMCEGLGDEVSRPYFTCCSVCFSAVRNKESNKSGLWLIHRPPHCPSSVFISNANVQPTLGFTGPAIDPVSAF